MHESTQRRRPGELSAVEPPPPAGGGKHLRAMRGVRVSVGALGSLLIAGMTQRVRGSPLQASPLYSQDGAAARLWGRLPVPMTPAASGLIAGGRAGSPVAEVQQVSGALGTLSRLLGWGCVLLCSLWCEGLCSLQPPCPHPRDHWSSGCKGPGICTWLSAPGGNRLSRWPFLLPLPQSSPACHHSPAGPLAVTPTKGDNGTFGVPPVPAAELAPALLRRPASFSSTGSSRSSRACLSTEACGLRVSLHRTGQRRMEGGR